MAKLGVTLLAGLALLALAPAAHAAAHGGRQVPTETIIVAPETDNDAFGPDIPVGSDQQPAAAAPDATSPGAATPPDLTTPDTGGPDAPGTPDDADQASDEPLPTIEYDVAKLPAPVKRLREQILEATATGDIDKLKPIIDANGEPPLFGFTEADEPLVYLKQQSGDPEGREILAILQEVLEAGYVHVDIGSTEEMYIWPYFARYPLGRLDGRQMVELFKIITAGDYEDMKDSGNYSFYRAGISPTGVWKYFTLGD